MFEELNCSADYLILRNWEDIYNESLYGAGKEDIDILCRSKKDFIEQTGAKPIHNCKHRDNYYVNYGPLKIRFDIRWVGDNYYPREWEEHMLRNKELSSLGVYVASLEDYCYSLAYHSVFQKKNISEKYLKNINIAFGELTGENRNMDDVLIFEELNKFMQKHRYNFVIPQDPAVYINWENVKQSMHSFELRYGIRRLFFNLKTRYLII